MNDFREKLDSLESPFNWKLKEIPYRLDATDLIEKLLEKEEEVVQPWVHLCLKLNVAYLHYENKDLSKSNQALQEFEHYYESSEDPFVTKYKKVFKSIFSASNAILNFKRSTLSEVDKFIKDVIPTSELDRGQGSCVFGIKANIFLEYGVNGTQMAVQFAREAVQRDPNEGHWLFVLAKLLGRLRHFEKNHMPSPEELTCLQSAHNKCGSVFTAVFLAQAYLEKAKTMRFEARKTNSIRSIKDELDALTSECKRLVFYALESNKDQCVHVMIRCAYVLYRLPYHVRDAEKAEEILNKALQLSPSNAMANRLAGDIFINKDPPDYDRGLKHYETAASRHVFSADCVIFEINTKLGKNINADEFYSRLLGTYKERNYQLQALIHAVEYFVFIRKDLFKTLNYFLKIIDIDPTFHELSSRFVKYIMATVNFYEIISNEARIAIENNLCSNVDQLSTLKNVILVIKKHQPNLMKNPIVHNNIQKIVEAAEEEEKKKMNFFNRNRGRGRGSGSFSNQRGRFSNQRGQFSNQRGQFSNQRGQFSNQRGQGNASGREQADVSNERMPNVVRGNYRNNSQNRNRGQRRNPSLDRSNPNQAVNDPNRPMNRREHSRDRFQSNKNKSNDTVDDLMEQLMKLQAKMNPFQANQIAMPSSKSCPGKKYEGQDNEENVNNPLYIKYLENKYKSQNQNESFQEWLEKCSNSHHSPAYSTDGKTDLKENKISYDMMEQLRQKLSNVEIKPSKISGKEDRQNYLSDSSTKQEQHRRSGSSLARYLSQRGSINSKSSSDENLSDLYDKRSHDRNSKSSRSKWDIHLKEKESKYSTRHISRYKSPSRNTYERLSRRRDDYETSPSRDKYEEMSRRRDEHKRTLSRDKYQRLSRRSDEYERSAERKEGYGKRSPDRYTKSRRSQRDKKLNDSEEEYSSRGSSLDRSPSRERYERLRKKDEYRRRSPEKDSKSSRSKRDVYSNDREKKYSSRHGSLDKSPTRKKDEYRKRSPDRDSKSSRSKRDVYSNDREKKYSSRRGSLDRSPTRKKDEYRKRSPDRDSKSSRSKRDVYSNDREKKYSSRHGSLDRSPTRKKEEYRKRSPDRDSKSRSQRDKKLNDSENEYSSRRSSLDRSPARKKDEYKKRSPDRYSESSRKKSREGKYSSRGSSLDRSPSREKYERSRKKVEGRKRSPDMCSESSKSKRDTYTKGREEEYSSRRSSLDRSPSRKNDEYKKHSPDRCSESRKSKRDAYTNDREKKYSSRHSSLDRSPLREKHERSRRKDECRKRSPDRCSESSKSKRDAYTKGREEEYSSRRSSLDRSPSRKNDEYKKRSPDRDSKSRSQRDKKLNDSEYEYSSRRSSLDRSPTRKKGECKKRSPDRYSESSRSKRDLYSKDREDKYEKSSRKRDELMQQLPERHLRRDSYEEISHGSKAINNLKGKAEDVKQDLSSRRSSLDKSPSRYEFEVLSRRKEAREKISQDWDSESRKSSGIRSSTDQHKPTSRPNSPD